MTFPSVTAYFVELLFAVFLIVTVRTVAGRWLGPGVKRLLWGLLILKALVPLTVATEHHPLGALAKLDVWVSPTATPAEPELARPADGGNSTPAMFPREFVPPGEFALPGDPAQLATIQSTEVEQPAAAAAPVTDAESPGFAATVTTSVVTTLPAVWLLGAVALFGLAVWRSRTVIRATTQDPVAVPDWVRTIFLDCREQIGLRTMPGLIVSPYIPSPCLVGVLRPRVLIPELLVEQRTPEAEQHIRHLLLHELTHLKQGDVWLTWLWTLTLAVQWFNPLFWLLNRHFRFDCETACDARVLTLLNDHERTDYGTSLLHVLIDTTPSRSVPRFATSLAPGFLGLTEPRSTIERRLTMMKSHRMPSLLRRLSAVVVLLLLATLCLTSYGQSKPEAAVPTEEAPKTEDTAKIDAPPPEAAPKAATTQPGPWKVTLSSGVTVEMVGVSEYPSAGKSWWQPDGLPLKERPYEGTATSRMSTEGRALELAIRMDNLPKDADIVFKLDPSKGSFGPGRARTAEGNEIADLWTTAVDVSSKQQSLTVKLGVAAGAWTTVGSCQGFGSASRVLNTNMIFSPALENDRTIDITVSHNVSDRDTRIVAVDKKGKVITGQRRGGGASGNVCQLTIVFSDVTLADIKEFRFQTRPYEWAEFKNVTLRPDAATREK